MKKAILPVLCVAVLCACNSRTDTVKSKLDSYATTEIGTSSLSGISDNGKQVLDYFKLVSTEIDNIY